MNKNGAFLTLGMTFISVLILTLGGIILKNAVSSESRIAEMGGMGRLYNVERSLQSAYSDMFKETLGLNMTLNGQWHSVELNLSARSRADDKLYFMNVSHFVFSEYLKTIYPSFRSSRARMLTDVNQSSWYLQGMNISYVYTHVNKDEADKVFFPAKASPGSQALIIYSANDDTIIKEYNITLKNLAQDGNVSWNYFTGGGTAKVGIAYIGKSGTSSNMMTDVNFQQPLGMAAQNVSINTTIYQLPFDEYPLITMSVAEAGPFAGMRQIMIQPMTFNFSAKVTIIYQDSAQTRTNATRFYSYDTFDMSFKELNLSFGKIANYQVM